jgi:RNA polymerase sigma factor (sigma-70 family)
MAVQKADLRNEQRMIEGCLRGERQAQEVLYHRFSQTLFAICLRYTGDYHQAEDMLQEGFIKVFSKLNSYRFEGSFEGWLKRIFINTAIENFRRNQHLNHTLEIEDLKNDLVQEDDFHRLSEAELLGMIQLLSPGYRTIFNLYAVEGYTHNEIASKLGITVGTSKSQLARARYLLQKMVYNAQRFNKYAAVF